MSVYPAALPTVRPAVRSAFEQGSGGGAASIIAGLFAQGQQGFWFPFTNFASLSQDSAGTLPYTALEQPVGRVLDRSGRGNHATQPTSTARGVVSARVNLLLKTEDFSDAVWQRQKNGTGVMPVFTNNYAIAPDGTATAARVQLDLGGGVSTGDYSNIGQLVGGGAIGATRSMGFWIKSNTVPTAVLINDDFSQVVTATIVTIGTDWQFLSYSGATTIATTRAIPVWLRGGFGTANAADLSIWHPQIVAGPLLSEYQRVNTAADYDSIGFPKSLRVEVDDFYTCGGGGSTTGFYYADVIRPMGGAGTRSVIWSDRSGNNGYELAINTANKLEFSAGNGTAITTVASTVSAALAEGKQYEVMDDGTVLSVQIDGSAPVTIARPVVTAGSSTITLYRGVSTGYFNGQVTEPIYRAGPPPSAYERSVIRGYQMQKAGL